MGCANKLGTKAQPVIAYGHSVLRKICRDVSKDEQGLIGLIENLWNSLEMAGGVGLATPQINNTNKVFVVNSKLMYDSLTLEQQKSIFAGDKGITETFINAKVIAESEETWNEKEGCLSIPGISESVNRAWNVIVEYYDISFRFIRKEFSGYTAKVIQHEYDHTNGVLFIDHLSALTKKLIKNRLKQVRDGKIETDYSIKYLKT